MAISINWQTKVITVPKADTSLVQASPTEIRDLDLDWFRLQLKDLEDDEAGMPHLDTHQHNTTVTVGGVTLARVIEIINGYTVTFEDGAYAVNLVGANSNLGDVLNFNQVQVRSSNSAGLTFSNEINAQSFTNNEISIDTANGSSGTQFPRGTPTDPVDNYTDALAVANAQNMRRFFLNGTLTLGSGDDLDDYTVTGFSPTATTLTLNSTSTSNTRLNDLRLLNGTLDGEIYADNCDFVGTAGLQGIFNGCGFKGTVVLDATPSGDIHITDGVCRAAGTSAVTFDINGVTVDVDIHDFTGNVILKNITGANELSIDMHNGSLTIDSSCTSGTVVVRGQVELTDNSGGGLTVTSDGVITETDPAEVADNVWDKSVPASPTAGTFGEKLKALMSVTDWLGLRD